MLISIFFMVASISLIIFVPIYVKKKNKLYSLNTQEKINVKRKNKNIKTIWGIEGINNSIITINGRNSIIMELGSIEYRLLNEKEQNNVDIALINLSKTFSYQTQFFSTIEKIDTTNKIEDIKLQLNKQKNNKIKEYGESIIEYLENIMQEENLYVRKNYLIITSNEIYQKAKTELLEFANNIKHSLSNIKIKSKILSDEDIIELIYRELNKNSNEKINNIKDKGGLDFYVQSKNRKKVIDRKKE